MDKMEDWKNMRDFAIEMITHSLLHRLEDMNLNKISNQRIAIINLDHATELLMKAFLLKNNYLINELDRNKIQKGIKKDNMIKDLIDNNKTISFEQALEISSKITNLNNDNKEIIKEFHKIRNEIQHRAKELPLNKEEKIEIFCPILHEFFKLMFPENIDEIEGMLIEPQ